MSKHDVIIIGAGHNALLAAFYLAKAGLKPLLLERRDVVGGACVTEELHPGFHCSTLAATAGPLLRQVIRDLQSAGHKVEFIKPPTRVAALNGDGPTVCIHEDTRETVSELTAISTADANNYPEFMATFARIGSVIRPLLTMTPPDIDAPSKGELWNFGKLGWAVRRLGKKDEYRLLRYGPMAVADLAAEWFETEALRAIIAARGIFGAFAGPWSAGTTAALLLQAATDGNAMLSNVFIKGGMGALTESLAKAVSEAGGEIRTNAEVTSVVVADGGVRSVVLRNGDELPATKLISGADPTTTFLKLLDAGELDPSFRNKIQNYRAVGTVAKLNLALAGLPAFAGVPSARLVGRIHVGPDIDYLERAFDAAKYGDFSPRPYLDVTIPTLTDPTLAPHGAHVMSIHAQFAPYKLRNGDWEAKREQLADTIVDTLSDYAPDLRQLIVARQMLTPLDIERRFGMTGGHIHHGEMALDQLFTFRPLIGWARYRTPIKGLYLCGSGSHPGGGVTGAPGFNASREVIKDLRK